MHRPRSPLGSEEAVHGLSPEQSSPACKGQTLISAYWQNRCSVRIEDDEQSNVATEIFGVKFEQETGEPVYGRISRVVRIDLHNLQFYKR